MTILTDKVLVFLLICLWTSSSVLSPSVKKHGPILSAGCVCPSLEFLLPLSLVPLFRSTWILAQRFSLTWGFVLDEIWVCFESS